MTKQTSAARKQLDRPRRARDGGRTSSTGAVVAGPKRSLIASASRDALVLQRRYIVRAGCASAPPTCTNTNRPLPARAALEQSLDRAQALEDALGVVEAVDADEQDRVRRAGREPLAHRLRGTRSTGACAASAAGGHSIEIG